MRALVVAAVAGMAALLLRLMEDMVQIVLALVVLAILEELQMVQQQLEYKVVMAMQKSLGCLYYNKDCLSMMFIYHKCDT